MVLIYNKIALNVKMVQIPLIPGIGKNKTNIYFPIYFYVLYSIKIFVLIPLYSISVISKLAGIKKILNMQKKKLTSEEKNIAH